MSAYKVWTGRDGKLSWSASHEFLHPPDARDATETEEELMDKIVWGQHDEATVALLLAKLDAVIWS